MFYSEIIPSEDLVDKPPLLRKGEATHQGGPTPDVRRVHARARSPPDLAMPRPDDGGPYRQAHNHRRPHHDPFPIGESSWMF